MGYFFACELWHASFRRVFKENEQENIKSVSMISVDLISISQGIK